MTLPARRLLATVQRPAIRGEVVDLEPRLPAPRGELPYFPDSVSTAPGRRVYVETTTTTRKVIEDTSCNAAPDEVGGIGILAGLLLAIAGLVIMLLVLGLGAAIATGHVGEYLITAGSMAFVAFLIWGAR